MHGSEPEVDDLLTKGFQNVDATAAAKILRCLDTLDTLDTLHVYKARALDCLALPPSASALDVACGRGDDVAAMRARCRRAVGVDLSVTLLDQARARHRDVDCEFWQGDASKLPFPSDTFDAVRIDRSLQHIANPGRVVNEMARVTRPGGIVLCAEPDWGTFLLGGPHSPIVDTIQERWSRSFCNPWIGRELAGLLGDAGVEERRCEGFWLHTQGYQQSDILFEIGRTVADLGPQQSDARAWLESYRQGEAYAGVLVMVCWGRKRA